MAANFKAISGKSLLFIIITVISFSACEKQNISKNALYFESNAWYYGDELIFRNDSVVSFTEYDTVSNQFKTDSAFPIQLSDTSLIYTRYREKGYYNKDREYKITHCERLSDTVKYDIKFINKKARLILYLEPFPLILSTKKEIDLPETNNFEPVKFIVADYSIGDQIDRSLLKTRGIYNYPNYTIEDCEYIENKDITFKIIGYNTIYSIERRRVEHYRVKDITKVVTSKLNIEPEYRPMRKWVDGADYEYEFYRWAGRGVQINLSRSRYVGDESYKKLVGGESWILSYDDSFLQSILIETYRNGKPQSSIIN